MFRGSLRAGFGFHRAAVLQPKKAFHPVEQYGRRGQRFQHQPQHPLWKSPDKAFCSAPQQSGFSDAPWPLKCDAQRQECAILVLPPGGECRAGLGQLALAAKKSPVGGTHPGQVDARSPILDAEPLLFRRYRAFCQRVGSVQHRDAHQQRVIRQSQPGLAHRLGYRFTAEQEAIENIGKFARFAVRDDQLHPQNERRALPGQCPGQVGLAAFARRGAQAGAQHQQPGAMDDGAEFISGYRIRGAGWLFENQGRLPLRIERAVPGKVHDDAAASGHAFMQRVQRRRLHAHQVAAWVRFSQRGEQIIPFCFYPQGIRRRLVAMHQWICRNK